MLRKILVVISILATTLSAIAQQPSKEELQQRTQALLRELNEVKKGPGQYKGNQKEVARRPETGRTQTTNANSGYYQHENRSMDGGKRNIENLPRN